MRVVIDSNVWISALVFGGKPRQVLEKCVKNGDEIIVSSELIGEIRRIIKHKFTDFINDFEDLLMVLKQFLVYYQIGENPVNVCRDPNDNFLLELAAKARVKTIVSGDKDLLEIKNYKSIKIITPSLFFSRD